MTSHNPILNNPYGEPAWHYDTDLEGALDYEKIVAGRRLFTGTVQAIPVRQKEQRSLFEINQAATASHDARNLLVAKLESPSDLAKLPS